jgi:hypothetical protein
MSQRQNANQVLQLQNCSTCVMYDIINVHHRAHTKHGNLRQSQHLAKQPCTNSRRLYPPCNCHYAKQAAVVKPAAVNHATYVLMALCLHLKAKCSVANSSHKVIEVSVPLKQDN